MDANSFKKPFKLDITNEFNELKEAFKCEACQHRMKQPVVLNTCTHTQCEACLDKKKLVCSICKYPYNEIDVSVDTFTTSVLQSIKNIENIVKNALGKEKVTAQQNISDDDEQEIACADALKVKQAKGVPSGVKDIPTPLSDIDYEIVIVGTLMKRNPKGETALHLACKKGNIDKVEELVKSGVDINAVDWANWAPIHEAVQHKHYNCVEFLLNNNALIDIPGADYITPLHKAITCNADNIINLLLRHGANKDVTDYSGSTPLDYVMTTDKQTILKNIEPKNAYIPKVFFNKEVIVYTGCLGSEKISLLSKKAKFVSLPDYLKHEDVTHLVVSDDRLNLNILFGILKGIFIVDVKWTGELPLHVFPFKHIVDAYRTVINKSIRNKLLRRPKLFDGIKFHITDHHKPTMIHGINVRKSDLALLIQAGGGKVLARPPAVRTAEEDKFTPYHARGSNNLKECCNYVIFDGKKKPFLLYKMKELQHRTSEWLIDCILNFTID